MGKRKKQQQLNDPILLDKVKRVKIQPKDEEFVEEKNQNEISDVDSQDVMDQLEEEMPEVEEELEDQQKSNYDKFLENLKIRQNKEVADKEKLEILKNLKKITIDKSQQPDTDPYKQHFDYDHEALVKENIVKEKLVEIKKKKTEKEKVREKMMEIFQFKEKPKEKENQNIKKQQQNEDIGNVNKIQLKEFELNPEGKVKQPGYQIDNSQQYILDNNSLKNFGQKINGHSQSFLEEKLQQEIQSQEKEGNFSRIPYSIMKNYGDLTYIDEGEINCAEFRQQYVSHILNHVIKGNQTNFKENQDKQNENNEKQDQQQQGEEEQEAEKNKGYTRCKVLILTPFKGDASCIIKEIIQQYTQKEGLAKTSFKQRFEEYYEDAEKFSEDDFRLGISITKSKSIKLFASFDHSDIIVTSPLGLRLKVGAKGDKDREFSFLSSIECLVMDRASTLYMQNFSHLEEVLEILNKIPKHKGMTNSLDEIRPYYFENMAKFYRQSIVYTECNFPELNSLRTRYFHNYKGQLVNKPYYQPLFEEKDILYSQEFNKIEISNFQNEFDERFEFFKLRIWEQWRNVDNAVIFCSSYFEYLKIKDYLAKINASFQGICEYTKKNRIHSRTTLWAKKQFRTILFSERTAFFDVWHLRKQQHILFYSLPKTAQIYKSLLDNLENVNPKTKIQCLFTKYDAIQLEKIVGTKNAKEFLADYNKNTSFII